MSKNMAVKGVTCLYKLYIHTANKDRKNGIHSECESFGVSVSTLNNVCIITQYVW